jgi:alpha 1,2-mannosyltransferase
MFVTIKYEYDIIIGRRRDIISMVAQKRWPIDNGTMQSPGIRRACIHIRACFHAIHRKAFLLVYAVYNRPRVMRLLVFLLALVLIVVLWYTQVYNAMPTFRSDMDSTMKSRPNFQVDTISTRWTDDNFQCLGWIETDTCEPENTYPRRALETKSCTAMIERKKAGFCQVRNKTSGLFMRFMMTSCRSVVNRDFTCEMARNFSEFALLARDYEHAPMATSLDLYSASSSHSNNSNHHQDHRHHNSRSSTNAAIVMIVYGKVMASAYAAIRILRDHGCKLPIEMWYRPDEMSMYHPIVVELVTNYNVHMREIFDPRAKGFHTKPHAVYYSAYDNILLLDADNIPVKDPTYLFEDPAFLRDGALFWPDYWQPDNSLFDVHSHSLLWQLLQMEFWDQFEQESGQVLINRHRSKAALNKLMFYSSHESNLIDQLSLVWGDKDLFRLAWRNTSTPYYMVQRPPAIGGIYRYPMYTNRCLRQYRKNCTCTIYLCIHMSDDRIIPSFLSMVI